MHLPFTDRAAYDFANLVDEVSGNAVGTENAGGKPYLLISGGMDPVGNYGEGVKEVFEWMREAGLETASSFTRARATNFK